MNERQERLKKIRDLRIGKSEEIEASINYDHRKSKLSKLVERYGIEEVAEATGLKMSSINQYLRNPKPNISDEKLELAREILRHA